MGFTKLTIQTKYVCHGLRSPHSNFCKTGNVHKKIAGLGGTAFTIYPNKLKPRELADKSLNMVISSHQKS